MKHYESIIDALNDLNERGYYADFTTDTVCLYCGELDIRLNPEAFQIDDVYRIEGGSNPDGSTVVYAITSSTGLKGTLVDVYGAYAKSLSLEMAKKAQYHPPAEA